MLANSRLALAAETLVVKTQSRPGFSLLKGLLWVMSLFYKGGVCFRNFLYDVGVLKEQSAPLPVVSVGSVIAGGAGKTPLIALLLEKIRGHVAVVSRGYRADVSAHPREVRESDTSDAVGDEPLLLKRRFPHATVIVCSSRKAAVEMARERGAKLVILDDGMQHRQLRRDLELAIIDNTCQRPYYLPRGMLRDDPRRLKEADFLFFRGEGKPGGIEMDLEIEAFVDNAGNIFKGKRVGLFCTIAKPYNFIASAEKNGLSVEMKWLLPDHCPIDEEQLHEFVKKCKKAQLDGVVCTEKDWVKLSHKALELPIYYAKAQMRIKSGHGLFDRLIAQMTEMI